MGVPKWNIVDSWIGYGVGIVFVAASLLALSFLAEVLK